MPPRRKTPGRPPLTPKQERFCEEYLKDCNGTQAAIRAGYSPKVAATAAYQNIIKYHVSERIAELRKRITGDSIASAEEVARVLTSILRTNLDSFLTMGADGVVFHDIGPETAGLPALKKAKTRTVTDAAGNEVVTKQFDEIELESKIAAAERLAKLLGYNAPERKAIDMDVTQHVSAEELSDDQLADIAANRGTRTPKT